jgi:aspartyl-tRNA(Asn)/glutamyl-tRNA(Gln) amidotransferase subunit A
VTPDWHARDLGGLLAALERGETTPRGLVEHFLERIRLHNPALNAFITVSDEVARRRAERPAPGPLSGVPLAHKDIFCTMGVRTTCASRMLSDFVPPYDATVVRRLDEAGALVLGKTNMDEFAMGSSNETSAFGPVRNPWDAERVPGGSSGGSAAAVAAGLVPAATGTDTGGSIRQPAAFCGISGLKPTYGRLSRYGMIAFASSLDQAGFLARSAEDLARLLAVTAGADPHDATSSPEPAIDYPRALTASLRGRRIGVVREFRDAGLDPRVARLLDEALAVFEKLGARLVDVSLPHLGLAVSVYYILAPAECSSNLARYDGVRYGHRAPAPRDLDDLYARSRGEGFGPEVKRRIMIGTYVLSHGYYDAYYLKAQRARALLQQEFLRVFADVDLLAGPTTPTVAFRLGEKNDDPLTMYLNDIYTNAVNLAGLPALSVPCGFVDGLPAGLQLIAAPFAEAPLLAAAHRYQEVTEWHRARPPQFS